MALPLTLIGTFGIMKLVGFSLDNLSLMALTIATGFVVDDAIVMIENIVRYIEAGEAPMQAALKGAKQIGFTIISLSVSLIAVFIPLLFMTGIVGRLFREFAITLSAAVAVSAFVSLTLTPMMCARLLKAEDKTKHGRLYLLTERMFQGMLDGYDRSLQWVLRHQPFTLGVALVTLVRHHLALYHHAQGPPAAAGHRPRHRRHRCRAVHLLQGHGHPPARHRRNCAARPGRGERGLLCRRRQRQPDRQLRPPVYQPKAPRQPPGQRRPDHRPPARRHGLGPGHFPLHAGGPGRAD